MERQLGQRPQRVVRRSCPLVPLPIATSWAVRLQQRPLLPVPPRELQRSLVATLVVVLDVALPWWRALCRPGGGWPPRGEVSDAARREMKTWRETVMCPMGAWGRHCPCSVKADGMKRMACWEIVDLRDMDVGAPLVLAGTFIQRDKMKRTEREGAMGR